MANRISLNATSYHGAGAISEVVTEINNNGFKKAFVASDPDLIKFGVTGKVTDLLDAAKIPYEIYSDIKPKPSFGLESNGSVLQGLRTETVLSLPCSPGALSSPGRRKRS